MPVLPSPATLTPSWRAMRVAVRVAGSLVLLAWSLFVVAWLVLHWAILPRIDHWRPDLERAASRALGVPAEIGHVRVESHGWVPTLELVQVRLRDSQGRVALQLGRVQAALSPSSLLHLEPRLRQLVVDAPVVDVRRDAQGRIFVAGLEVGRGGAPAGENREADWLFSQDEVVVRGGTVRWIDEARGAAPLALTEVDLVLRNGGGLGSRRHDWRLDATPPAGWGGRFSLRGRFAHPLLGRPGDLTRWSGTAYAELPYADVHRLRQYADLPFHLQQGSGALRLWAQVREGEPVAATLDLALRDVNLQLVPDADPVVLERLDGRVQAERRGQDYQVSARQLGFRTGEGAEWAPSDWHVSWKTGPDGRAHDGDFRADRLDLALLAALAEKLPIGAALRRELAELTPAGVVEQLQARWQGPIDAPRTYRAEGRVRGLQLAAEALDEEQLRARHVGRPGLRGAQVQFSASERGGQAQLSIGQGEIVFPGVFEEPAIPLERLEARLDWTLARPAGAAAGDPDAPPAVELRVREARFANADAEGQLEATWRTGAGADVGPGGRLPGVLELTGRLSRADAARIWRYLPLEMPRDVRDYVRRAVVAGTARQVDFRVKGDLWHFPYADARQGDFHVAAQVEDTTFAYAPGDPTRGEPPWPAFTQVHGRLVFDRTAMRMEDVRARLYGFELSGIRGGIANLMHESVLALEGQGKGPLADALRFVKETPVDEWTGHALKDARGSGEAQLRLGVQLPLHRMENARVNGVVTLLGNEVQVVPDTPVMSQARGQVQFSDQGFAVRGATARVLGGEASFEGGTQKDGTMRFTGQGVATAEGMRLAGEIAWLPYLAEHLRGRAAYRVTLQVTPEGAPQLQVTSALQGMEIRLPPPLAKPASSAWPLRIETALTQAAAPGRAARDRLTVELGDRLHARYERELREDGTRVLAGAIGLPERVEPPAEGVVAIVHQQALDVDAWRAVADSFEGLAEPAHRREAGAPRGAEPAGPGQPDYLPSRIALRADELTVDQRRLTRVVVGLSHEAGRWRANLDADQLNGYVEYRPPGGGAGPGGQLYARLSRLALPESAAEEVDSLLDQAPAHVPALDVVVEDFRLHDLQLGRVEVEAHNRRSGEIREWRLDRLLVATPEARLLATGNWRGTQGSGTRRRTDLDFRLEIADAGALLERFGLKQVVRRGKGSLEGRIGWLGSPLALDHGSLDGQFRVDVAKGQFLKAEPGIAKLAGILSLQSLPRRLTLDFRDVFQEGFAFDAFAGDVRIQHGVAQTNNLRLRGVTAAVLMEGSADIGRETQDLRVLVIPEINAGTASLAYAVINPAVGLGTFLAQMFLRKPLMQASTREFHVTGSWTDPKVEPVQRRLGEPVPEDALEREARPEVARGTPEEGATSAGEPR